MPPKLRQLLKILESVGFVNRGGKGSHRNYRHPRGVRITLSGKPSEDAKPYQERAVQKALEDLKE
jgi:predicted RNA binding protein YcfA (HicA-like mRNA interferase family)